MAQRSARPDRAAPDRWRAGCRPGSELDTPAENPRAASSDPVAASSIVVDSFAQPFSNDSPGHTGLLGCRFPYRQGLDADTDTLRHLVQRIASVDGRFHHRGQTGHGDSPPEVGQHAVDALGGVGQATQPRLIESKAVLVWSTALIRIWARLLAIRLCPVLVESPAPRQAVRAARRPPDSVVV